ncbi:bifunctional glutamate N-acetyltransferase/amino-acid acetyltransferase ArgJ [uncultured Anaerotruncus sp.]|uniref:bifunctional glutamate N-acetyltransferase/amino-acid acetyltransferase ArgJ n=1 Tax=uncultured Anaerotruncus sp. TaxID=905011 RepID=UPI00280B36F0|nr:bifunctional glutamate N-acetyltransferase/amino-acid acetyltransferase ArgJ [uncultured Anaerotruncus sp.]
MSYTFVEGGVCAAKGFLAGAVHAGIRKNRAKNDLALIVSKKPCAAAAIYTQNKVKGAPILVTQAHLRDGRAKAFLCNSGNANTCNADGVDIATAMCGSAAAALKISPDDVIVASTGVIGQPLPLGPITAAMPSLAASLSEAGSADAAEAIMTTDTKRKEVAVRFSLGGKTCTVGGIAKGSGMIHPNMATMLCFVTTDAAIAPALLQKALKCVADETFNMVSVDGDTSTNDMLSILANGEAGNPEITSMDADYYHFAQGLMMVCRQIARELAADGEGASKLLECTVTGAPDKETARKVAKSVVCSSLFKAAMFGEDANWGRILCAIGYTDAEFEIDRVAVTLASDAGSIHVCENGAGVPFSEETAKTVLGEKEIRIEVDMGQGGESATAWGCDLTYDYVKINGDYRT